MKNELTDAAIDALLVAHGKGDDGFHGFARAVIAAHEVLQDDASFGQDAYSFTGTLVQIVDKKVAEIAALKAALQALLDRYVQAVGNEGIECYQARAAMAQAVQP